MINLGNADRAIAFLKTQHPWLYTDMTEPLRLGTADECIIIEDCVIIKVGGTWMWAPFTDKAETEAANLIKEKMDKDDGLCLHCSHDPEETRKILNIEERLTPCFIAVRLTQDLFDIKTDAVLKPLTLNYLDFVIQTYRMAKFYTNPEESFRKIIEDGMTGAFIDGEIAGFIGSHSEGSIGMLEVLPKFRRRGLGKALEQYRINTYIKEGKVPYCHILETNEVSLALEKALGYNISDESSVYWLN